MFSGDDFHTVKEALIFVTVWKVIESLVTYLGDKIPALYRARNSAAAKRLSKARKAPVIWKRGKGPVALITPNE